VTVSKCRTQKPPGPTFGRQGRMEPRTAHHHLKRQSRETQGGHGRQWGGPCSVVCDGHTGRKWQKGSEQVDAKSKGKVSDSLSGSVCLWTSRPLLAGVEQFALAFLTKIALHQCLARRFCTTVVPWITQEYQRYEPSRLFRPMLADRVVTGGYSGCPARGQ